MIIRLLFFSKKNRFYLAIGIKAVYLHRLSQRVFVMTLIGVWCNGNTTDSGPVIPGSNPGTPT